jgi:hypothetical protein
MIDDKLREILKRTTYAALPGLSGDAAVEYVHEQKIAQIKQAFSEEYPSKEKCNWCGKELAWWGVDPERSKYHAHCLKTKAGMVNSPHGH